MLEPHGDPTFQYDELPNSKTHLRLLKVIEGSFDQPVVCELTTWPVDGTPQYNAISYTWGDPRSVTSIIINGRTMQIRQNCEYVLQQAFAFSPSDYYWCDAVCIDQSNLQEKGDQVAMFGSLYAKAAHVLVCVGKHGDDSEFLFEVLRQKADLLKDIVRHAKYSEGLREGLLPPPLRSHQPAHEAPVRHVTKLLKALIGRFQRNTQEAVATIAVDQGTWSSDPPPVGRLIWLRCALDGGKLDREGLRDALSALLGGVQPHARERIMLSFVAMMQRPYFRRLWVLQELQLGRKKALCCGKDNTEFETLFGLHQLVKVWQWDLYARGSVGRLMKWMNERTTFSLAAIRIASGLHKVEHELGCLKLGVFEGRPIDLPHLLEALVYFKCADMRDKIYGSLALSTWNEWKPKDYEIFPDYTITGFRLAEEVLTILLWHQGKAWYGDNPRDSIGQAKTLRLLLNYSPEDPAMRGAMVARNGALYHRSNVIQARLRDCGWFGVRIKAFDIVREENRLYCKQPEKSTSPSPWVELVDFNGAFVAYAPLGTKAGDCLLVDGLRYRAGSRPPGIIMRTCTDGGHLLLGMTYPYKCIPPRVAGLSDPAIGLADYIDRQIGKFGPSDDTKWFAIRWSAGDLLLLEWRYMLLDQYADDPSHHATRDRVEDWCAQRICISSRSSYALGPFDAPEDNFITMPDAPGMIFGMPFHSEERFFESNLPEPVPVVL